MKNSVILGVLINLFARIGVIYNSSVLCRVIRGMGQSFGRYSASSRILSFFGREWNIESAWKKSLAFRILISPLRLLKLGSDKLSQGTNNALEGSMILNGIKGWLENLFVVNTRIYGLLFIVLAAVQGLLELVLQKGEPLLGAKGIIRLVLLLAGAALILINKPVKKLAEGSTIGRLIYDFFTLNESSISFEADVTAENNIPLEEMSIAYRSQGIIAVVAGVMLGILGYVLPAKVFILAAGAMIGIILVLWRYEIGVYTVIGLIPVAPTMALLGLILFTALSYGIKLFRDKKMQFRVTILDYFVIMFGMVLCYSGITSYTPGKSIFALLIYIACILFYFILVNTLKSRQQLYAMAALLVVSTTLIALYGLYQMKTVGATSAAWVDTTLFEDIKARVGSTFENPNVLGEYLVLIIPVAIAMLWGQKNWITKLVTLGLVAIMLVCLVYTYSRGAYIGLMLAFALFAVLRDRRFVILGVIGLLMLPFVLPPSVINRFTSIGNLSDTSSSYRISVWLGSLKLAKDYWPSGIGLGLEPFKLIYPKYSLNAAYAHHSHNIYLQLLIETGIAGFLMFLSIIIIYYKTMLAGFYKAKGKFISTFMIAIASGMAGYLAQGMVENIWYNNRVLLTFWVILALGMTAKALITKDNEVLDI